MVSKRIVGMLLLLILSSVALSAGEAPLPEAEPGLAPPAPAAQALPFEPSTGTEALPPLNILDTVLYATCTCEGRCGECGGRLRGCYNGFPICECFHC
jgi:hypothetical protein